MYSGPRSFGWGRCAMFRRKLKPKIDLDQVHQEASWSKTLAGSNNGLSEEEIEERRKAQALEALKNQIENERRRRVADRTRAATTQQVNGERPTASYDAGTTAYDAVVHRTVKVKSDSIHGDGFWMKLDLNQEKPFRQWARDNFDRRKPVDPAWHPVVRDEWEMLLRVLPNPGGRLIRVVPSSRNVDRPNASDRVEYEIRMVEETGLVWCGCLGWAFSDAKPKQCRHMKEWAEQVAKNGTAFKP